jgi:hypothetical protein
MGCQVAVPAGPFGIRVGAGEAEFSGGEYFHAFAPFAFFDDGIALPAVITAPLLGHEGAIDADFDYLAIHFLVPPKKINQAARPEKERLGQSSLLTMSLIKYNILAFPVLSNDFMHNFEIFFHK